MRQARRSTEKKEEKNTGSLENTRLSKQQTDPGKDRKRNTHIKHSDTRRLVTLTIGPRLAWPTRSVRRNTKTENESAFRGNDMRAQNANQPEASKTSRIVLGRDETNRKPFKVLLKKKRKTFKT